MGLEIIKNKNWRYLYRENEVLILSSNFKEKYDILKAEITINNQIQQIFQLIMVNQNLY